jgi:hypothetical protein
MVEIISKGTKMLNQKELFNNAMGRLLTLYKDSPAQIEAVQNTAKVASALMEMWTERSIGSMVNRPGINTFGGTKGEVKKPSNKPSPKEAPATISDTQKNSIKEMMLQWVKADPVSFKKCLVNDLEPALKEVIKKRYSGVVDDPEKEFNDEVSGAAETREKAAAEKEKAAAAKEKAKEEKKEALKKKAEGYRQKADEYKNRSKYEELADKADTTGYESSYEDFSSGTNGLLDKDEYEKANKKKKFSFGSLLRKAKDLGGEYWNKAKAAVAEKRANLEEAIKNNDVARIESIRAELMHYKELCEAAGIDINALMG